MGVYIVERKEHNQRQKNKEVVESVVRFSSLPPDFSRPLTCHQPTRLELERELSLEPPDLERRIFQRSKPCPFYRHRLVKKKFRPPTSSG